MKTSSKTADISQLSRGDIKVLRHLVQEQMLHCTPKEGDLECVQLLRKRVLARLTALDEKLRKQDDRQVN